MSRHRVVLTECNVQHLRDCLRQERLEMVHCRESGRNAVCEVSEEALERFYELVKDEAVKAWQEQSARLDFDSAFFPSSARSVQPMRQLRGALVARMHQGLKNLAPADCTPFSVYGKVKH